SFFNFSYDLWKDWRKTKIEKSTSQTSPRRRRCCTGCDMTVTDELTNNKYSLHWSNNDDICDTIAEMTKSRILNEACGYMAKALQPIMYLQRYIPGMESAKVQVLPAVEQVSVGPYAAVTQDTEDGTEVKYNSDTLWYANEDGKSGDITTTGVWAFNVV
ncbi:dfa, partial [Symbiodinium microadriaticum]